MANHEGPTIHEVAIIPDPWGVDDVADAMLMLGLRPVATNEFHDAADGSLELRIVVRATADPEVAPSIEAGFLPVPEGLPEPLRMVSEYVTDLTEDETRWRSQRARAYTFYLLDSHDYGDDDDGDFEGSMRVTVQEFFDLPIPHA